MNIRAASIAADLLAVRGLFQEYQQRLGFSLCFQGFTDKLRNLPGKNTPPDGRLLPEAAVAGYRRMRLDMRARLTPALRLYGSLGFRPVAANCANSQPDVVCLECDLPAPGELLPS